jgi:outer membrane protein insertion porin family
VVKVDVEEQPTGSLSFGASYGLASGVGLNVGFSETNFLGRGQGLALSITSGTDSNEGSLTFSEPAFLGRDLKLKFTGFYRETTQASASYDTSNIMISPSIEFPVSANGRLELRLKGFQDSITNVDPASSEVLQQEAAVEAKIGVGIGYSYSYDTRVSGLNPNGGVLLRFGQDFVGLGGDVNYVSSSALALAETKVFNEEVTVRAVFEGGMINSFGGYQTRVTDRFFGNGKVRGFETNGYGPRDREDLGGAVNNDALGGNIFAVAKFEADFPLGLPEEYGINGGVFLDIGSVWGLDNTIGSNSVEVDDSLKLRSAVGFSVFWKTPIGPLRFNFSKALLKESFDIEQTFDLTISTKF